MRDEISAAAAGHDSQSQIDKCIQGPLRCHGGGRFLTLLISGGHAGGVICVSLLLLGGIRMVPRLYGQAIAWRLSLPARQRATGCGTSGRSNITFLSGRVSHTPEVQAGCLVHDSSRPGRGGTPTEVVVISLDVQQVFLPKSTMIMAATGRKRCAVRTLQVAPRDITYMPESSGRSPGWSFDISVLGGGGHARRYAAVFQRA